MILRDFKINDLERNGGYKNLPDLHQKMLRESLLETNSIAYTLEHDDQIICSGGFIEYWPGFMEGWGLISDLIFKYPIATHKAVKTIIPMLEDKYKVRRLQTVCLKIAGHTKWLERLGFKFEGEMPGFGINGETYLRYARVK